MFSILRHICIKITIRNTDNELNYEQDCDILILNKQTPQTKLQTKTNK